MHAKGTAYLMVTPDEKPAYLTEIPEEETLPEKPKAPKPSPWSTLYIAAGKKDKVNKIDIVGLLLKKGGLDKDELGLIEVLDYSSYAAVKRNKIEGLVHTIKGEKVKNKKVKFEISI
jgi:ATP-independent RNA helicase DbpA